MKYENSWTQPGEGFLKELKLNEIDFASADALKSYKSKHTMRPDTVVNVAGKKTKAVDVLGKDAFKDDEKGDGKAFVNLADGEYDESESHNGFLDALNAWRNEGKPKEEQTNIAKERKLK